MTPYYGTGFKIESMKKKILFLCTGNSCRSQMAEGFARLYLGNKYQIYSAGIEKHGMNPRAMQVMKEIGVSIDEQYSKTLEDLGTLDFDFVFTVCAHANENCPLFTGKARVIHKGFEDPPKLAQNKTNEEDILNCYRQVRDQMADWIKNLCNDFPS